MDGLNDLSDVETVENSAFVIPCDSCHAAEGTLCCSKCKSVYYCSKECQKDHWQKRHKAICTQTSQLWEKYKTLSARNTQHEENTKHAESKECAICLDAIAQDALVLPCNHSFCTECIARHESKHDPRQTPCPLCRSTSNIWNYSYLNAQSFMVAAKQNRQRKQHYLDLARRALSVFQENPSRKSPAVKALEAALLYLETEYKRATITAEPLLVLKKNPEEKGVIIDLLCTIAKSQLALGKYVACLEACERLEPYVVPERTTYLDEFTHLFVWISACRYHLGDYTDAVGAGNVAIKINRAAPDVHRVVALAYKALGRWDEAVLTMRRAVKYERPWDPDQVAANQAVLESLLAERMATTALSDPSSH